MSRWSEAEARMKYIESHWGLEGEDAIRQSSAPDPRAGVLAGLGWLYEITYLTKKAGDSKPVLYEHTFERQLPLLAYNDSGLVIVRAGSIYRVTSRGIVG